MASTQQDVADRIGRLARAIASAVKRGDTDAIVKWTLRMADAATSLAVAVSPALAKAEEAEVEVPVYAHVLTYDEEHEVFLAAEDVLLRDAGRPYGHGGAERGALPLSTHIDLARKLNLPLHLAEFESFVLPGVAQ